MRVLLVHPSPLLFSEIYLRLEPLGLECVAAAAEAAGHDVRLLDLQVFTHRDYYELLASWQPEAIGFSLNYYLANLPEVIDLAVEAKRRLHDCGYIDGLRTRGRTLSSGRLRARNRRCHGRASPSARSKLESSA